MDNNNFAPAYDASPAIGSCTVCAACAGCVAIVNPIMLGALGTALFLDL